MKNKKCYVLMLIWNIALVNLTSGQTPYSNRNWKLDFDRSNEFDFNLGKNIPLDSQMIYFNGSENNYHSPVGWINKYTLYDEFYKIDSLKFGDTINYIALKNDTGNLKLTSTGALKFIIKKHPNRINRTYYKVDWAGLSKNNWKDIELFITDSLTRDFQYSTSNIECNSFTKIPFFLEISVKIPSENHSGSQFNCFNYGDRALTKDHQPPGYIDTLIHSEIDLFEYSGTDELFTHNVHFKSTDNIHYALNNTNIEQNEANNINFRDLNWVEYSNVKNQLPMDTFQKNGFHKYGMEVTKSYIAYYVDDIQVDFVYIPGDLINSGQYFPNNKYTKPRMADHMSIEIGVLAGSGFRTADTPLVNTVFPIEYEVDYIRYYSLDPNLLMSSNSLVATNYDLSQHDERIYKNINLGSIFNINTVGFKSGSNSTTIRATEYILLNDGFFIDNGQEIYIIDTFTDNE